METHAHGYVLRTRIQRNPEEITDAIDFTEALYVDERILEELQAAVDRLKEEMVVLKKQMTYIKFL